MLSITLLSDRSSWKNEYIRRFAAALQGNGHAARCVHDIAEIPTGDILFILGFFKVLPASVLTRNSHNIVVHESELPRGRGWSPMSWQILEGNAVIPLTLFEAVAKVDAGKIYLRGKVPLKGNELLTELRVVVAEEMIRLCDEFIHRYPGILSEGVAQEGTPTYYAKRTADSSRLDPQKPLSEQFDLLRIVDNDSYPAYFVWRGATYILRIEKQPPGGHP